MKSTEAPIAFLDSGVGGLPYLEWVRSRLPAESYVYVADSAHFPYGEKSAESLEEIVLATTEAIIDSFSPRLIVVACNTASVAALSALRSRFSVPFVGVVPAVKPAGKIDEGGDRKRSIGLLATERTVNEEYTRELIRNFASNCYVESIGDGSMVDFIEHRYLDSTKEERRELLRASIGAFKKIDRLVLGCTHFTFIEDDLREILGNAIEIIDSREGVGKQVMKIVKNLEISGPKTPTAKLYTTSSGKTAERYRRFARLFHIEFAGLLSTDAGRLRAT